MAIQIVEVLIVSLAYDILEESDCILSDFEVPKKNSVNGTDSNHF